MNTALKTLITALPLILLLACAKQEPVNDVAATSGTAEPVSSDDLQSAEGELAAPADAADIPESESATDTAALGADEHHDGQLADTAAQSSTDPAAVSVAPSATTQTDAAQAATVKVDAAPMVDEAKILGDKQGQWASTAKASSSYASDPGLKAAYSAWQATGAPNVPRYSDNAASWAPKTGDAPVVDWLEVGFVKAVHGKSLRVRQSAAPGVISRVELIDEAGSNHVVWEGTDTTPYEKNTIGWFVADFPQTEYKVKAARLTLATSRVWGWNEIDAVQLVGVE